MVREFIYLLCAVAAVTLCGASNARGDTAVPEAPNDAEAHITRGLELRRQRRDEDALAEFRAAYTLQKSGRALAQVALAEDAIGLWVEAEDAFEGVLSTNDDPWVEKWREQLATELRNLQTHLSDLDLNVSPPTAEVRLNGVLSHPHAATATFRVVSGRVLVEVNAAGFESARRVLAVPPRARVAAKIALEASAAPPESEAPARPPLVVATPALRPATPSSGGEPTSVPRVLALSALGLAGAAFVTGTVGAIERTSALNTYNNNVQCDYGGVPRSVRCAGAASDFDKFTAVMTVGYVTAAVAALTGGVLALTLPRGVRVDASESGKTGLMLSVRGDF